MSSHLVSTALASEAATLIDNSGVLDIIATGMKEDAKHRGGRSNKLSTRSLLIAWLTLSFEGSRLFNTRVAELLTFRLSPEAADIIGVPAEFADEDPRIMEERVHRATQKMLAVLDYKPVQYTPSDDPLGKRKHDRRCAPTQAQWDSVLGQRATQSDALEVRRRRFFAFANNLLRAQYDTLPDIIKTTDISVTIDATHLDAFGNKVPKAGHKEDRLSSDPDAGSYVRKFKDQKEKSSGRHMDDLRKWGWGWEYELVALLSNDPTQPRAVPHIVLGFGVHPSASGSNPVAREIFEDLVARGFRFDHVVGDQAYFPGAQAEMLQHYLRGHGAKLVMKYPKNSDLIDTRGENTIQVEKYGAHMIEGRWYCPAMPELIRAAMDTFRKAVKADSSNPHLSPAERKARKAEHRRQRDLHIIERRKYELREKQTNEDGSVVRYCPAVGAGRSVNCCFKPNQPAPHAGNAPAGVDSPPKAPGKICTNKSSVTFKPTDGDKWEQYYRYGSPEWHQAHSYGRQVIESYNRSLKDGDNTLASKSNHRLKGEVGQAFLVLLGVLALNRYKMYEWQQDYFDATKPAPARSTRQSRIERLPVVARRRRSKGAGAGRRARWGLPPAPTRALRS